MNALYYFSLNQMNKDIVLISYIILIPISLCMFLQVQEGRWEGTTAGSHADLFAKDSAAHRSASGRLHHFLCPHPETDPKDLPCSRTGVFLNTWRKAEGALFLLLLLNHIQYNILLMHLQWRSSLYADMPSFNKTVAIKASIFLSLEANFVHRLGVALQFQHN